MRRVEFYATAGPHTDLARHAARIRDLDGRPEALARMVGQLLLHRDAVEASCGALPPERSRPPGYGMRRR